MASSRRVQALITLAQEDLRGAEVLLDSSTRLARYHVQQAAEKIVKAFLEHQGVDPGREHRFDALAEMLPEPNPWRARIKALDELSPAATTRRYPTAEGRIHPAPERSLVEQERSSVQQLLADVTRHITSAATPSNAVEDLVLKDRTVLAKQVVAAAKRRNLDVPENAEEKLAMYADDVALRAMMQAVTSASSFQDILDAGAHTKVDDPGSDPSRE
jgi:HEPN domain-containing protein